MPIGFPIAKPKVRTWSSYLLTSFEHVYACANRCYLSTVWFSLGLQILSAILSRWHLYLTEYSSEKRLWFTRRHHVTHINMRIWICGKSSVDTACCIFQIHQILTIECRKILFVKSALYRSLQRCTLSHDQSGKGYLGSSISVQVSTLSWRASPGSAITSVGSTAYQYQQITACLRSLPCHYSCEKGVLSDKKTADMVQLCCFSAHNDLERTVAGRSFILVEHI